MPVRRCFIGLGSNIGDGPAMIQQALEKLAEDDEIDLLRVSSMYRTAAWGRTDQADFTNAVAELTTGVSASQLLAKLLLLEQDMGRKRDTGHWGPRLIDLDLLCHADEQITTTELILPHPRMHERAFVLVPLLELEPDFEIPGLGSARKFLEKLAQQPVQMIV
jgi:2-amino-4-hydroxy-6-hydroxymethyldihydropteridine diphosphokinase